MWLLLGSWAWVLSILLLTCMYWSKFYFYMFKLELHLPEVPFLYGEFWLKEKLVRRWGRCKWSRGRYSLKGRYMVTDRCREAWWVQLILSASHAAPLSRFWPYWPQGPQVHHQRLRPLAGSYTDVTPWNSPHMCPSWWPDVPGFSDFPASPNCMAVL